MYFLTQKWCLSLARWMACYCRVYPWSQSCRHQNYPRQRWMQTRRLEPIWSFLFTVCVQGCSLQHICQLYASSIFRLRVSGAGAASVGFYVLVHWGSNAFGGLLLVLDVNNHVLSDSCSLLWNGVLSLTHASVLCCAPQFFCNVPGHISWGIT